MHVAVRSPLAAGVALVGAGAIAASPIAATPPDVHIPDLRMTLTAMAMQTNPVTAFEQLVGQTLTDLGGQTARVVNFPIAKALVSNVTSALDVGETGTGFGAPRSFGTQATVGTAATTAVPVGGVVGQTVQSILQDGVATVMRLVPASVQAVSGIATSTLYAITQIALTTANAILNVGAAVLTLNPGTVVDAVANGAVNVASVAVQTTIGLSGQNSSPAPAQAQTALLEKRPVATPPSILSSILNGRADIANAISPAQRALSAAAQTTTALVAQNTKQAPVAKAVVHRTAAANTGPKHAKSK
jgi:hypothetical protein